MKNNNKNRRNIRSARISIKVKLNIRAMKTIFTVFQIEAQHYRANCFTVPLYKRSEDIHFTQNMNTTNIFSFACIIPVALVYLQNSHSVQTTNTHYTS